MSNPVKSLGRAVKKVFKTVTNVVKDNWKLIVAGAAIYFTGGAMGLWSTPFTSTAAAGGAAAGAGSGVGGAVAGATEAATVAGAAATPGAVPLANATGTVSSLAKTSALSQAAPNTSSLIAGLGGGGSTAGTGATLWGGVKGAAKAMLGFVAKNPTAGLIAGNMLSSAFTPTAAEEQIKLDKYRRQNSSYFGVPGTAGTGAQGSDVSGLFNLTPRQSAIPVVGAAPAPDLPGATGLIGSRLAF